MKVLLDNIDDGNAISKLYTTISLLQKRVEELEELVNIKDDTISDLELDLSSTFKELDRRETHIDELDQEVYQQNKEIEKLKDTVSSLEYDLDFAKGELENAQHDCNRRENELINEVEYYKDLAEKNDE